MTKAIFFDLGYTLIKPNSQHWFLSPLFYEHFPKDQIEQFVSKERQQQLTQQLTDYLRANHYIHTTEEEEKIFTRFFQILLDEIPEDKRTITAKELAHDRVTNFSQYTWLEGSEETLKTLKEKGLKIALISDTWPSFKALLLETGFLQYFDALCLSCQLNCTKPDPRMWTTALDQLHLEAEDCIFVDDLPANLHAAEQLGFTCIQSLADPKIKQDSHYPSILTPRDLLKR